MGYIHSLETFGTVDGPGVRFVVFFQGCPMRCQYCHNPDTWNPKDGQQMEAGEIIARFLRNASFYKTGGITATGGEPMLQIDFLRELFAMAKQAECAGLQLAFREDVLEAAAVCLDGREAFCVPAGGFLTGAWIAGHAAEIVQKAGRTVTLGLKNNKDLPVGYVVRIVAASESCTMATLLTLV